MVVVVIVNVIIEGIVVVVQFDLFHEVSFDFMFLFPNIIIRSEILILVLFLLRNRNLLCPGLGTGISVWQGCPATKENCSC
jgi:hypothetical protein